MLCHRMMKPLLKSLWPLYKGLEYPCQSLPPQKVVIYWAGHLGEAAYCQVIRVPNHEKRLRWVQEYLGKDIDDIIWTDEMSVQMETHRRFCCRKRRQKPRYKPRPKHPPKVHVWAGISWNGATKACIFEGIMNADLYCGILDGHLVPFIQTVYPHSRRFMQDNDRKNTSRWAAAFFAERDYNWWKTPPESPDANPIENLWHELKVRMYTCMCLCVF